MTLAGRAGQRTSPAQRAGVIAGVVKSCNPLCVRIGDRELGPLTSLVATSALTVGKAVILARLEDDPATLVVVGVVGGPPAAAAVAGGGGSPDLFVQHDNPGMTSPGMWIQTGLGASGADMTIWVETEG